MGIAVNSSADGAALTIRIDGRFDFSCHQDFRRAYEMAGSKPQTYSVDLQAATYLDSSALGMLLLLRDYAGGEKSRISIVNCNADVKKILTISNFDKLFSIR